MILVAEPLIARVIYHDHGKFGAGEGFAGRQWLMRSRGCSRRPRQRLIRRNVAGGGAGDLASIQLLA